MKIIDESHDQCCLNLGFKENMVSFIESSHAVLKQALYYTQLPFCWFSKEFQNHIRLESSPIPLTQHTTQCHT
jgi:hypothetical protein